MQDELFVETEFPTAQEVQFTLRTVLGQTALDVRQSLPAGRATTTLGCAALPAGAYMLEVRTVTGAAGSAVRREAVFKR